MDEGLGMKRNREVLRIVFLVFLLFAVSMVVAEESSDTLETMNIISTTPLPATGVPENQVPNRVQVFDSEDIEKSNSLGIADLLNSNLSNVNINAAQNNPLQPDVQFRGFTASPLLGLPIGLAVYQNGVRINEPLGDTVNWDLISQDAIASIQLVAGANPLFGLNALGGAITVQTKNGFTHPGHSAEIFDGEFSRTTVSLQSGGNNGTFAYYVNFNRFEESGWRDLSRSDANNYFGSLAYRNDKLDLNLNVQHADTDLTGNGAAPIELLREEYDAIFTAPDITENKSTMVSLDSSYWLNDNLLISGNVYWRDTETDPFNGDLAEDDDDDDGDDDDDDVEFNAVNNISSIEQETRGASLQATHSGSLFNRNNQIIFGAAFNRGASEFDAQVQLAALDPLTRSTVTSGAVTGPFDDDETDISARTVSTSIYFSDTLSLNERLSLTASARYDVTRIRLRDRTGEAPELDGNHTFERVNPAIGLTYQLNPYLNIFGGYSQSSRAPTPIELSCNEEVLDMAADPDEAECRLPNAFLADPPLDDVVAQNFEIGLRGGIANRWSWHLGAFHTDNRDDIIFQTTGRATGLFTNVDKTRRVGFDASLGNRGNRFEWNASYSYLRATFEDSFFALSPNNPNAADLDGDGEDDEIAVSSGDRIPGFPEHTLKVTGSYELFKNFSIGGEWAVNDGQFLRGDESNEIGRTPGYGIFNLTANYQPHPQVDVFLRVDNVFDKEYFTFGIIGEEPDEAPGLDGFEDPRFLGPGPERGAWIGLRVNFGRESDT